MEEIKFRYRVKDLRKASGNYQKELFVYVTIEQLEKHHKTFECLEIIARDRFTSLKDNNGKEVYGGDIIYNKFENISLNPERSVI